MMKRANIDIMLIILIVVISITLAPLFNNRYDIENRNKNVEFMIDYKYISDLSAQSEKSEEEWLEFFKSLGFGTVAIYEDSILSLGEKYDGYTVDVLKNIVSEPNWQSKYNKSFVAYVEENSTDLYSTIIRTSNEEAYEFLINGLKKRYDEEVFKSFHSDKEKFIIIFSTEKDAMYSTRRLLSKSDEEFYKVDDQLAGTVYYYNGVGFDEEKIMNVKRANMNVTLRPINDPKNTEKLVDAYTKELELYDLNENLIMFTGNSVLGYEKNMKSLSDYIIDRQMTVALIETNEQRKHIDFQGLDGLISNKEVRTVRVFSVWDWISKSYDAAASNKTEVIENVLYRGITERNINVIYFRPFLKNDYEYITNFEDYSEFMDNLGERLSRHNIEIGDFSIMKGYTPPKSLLMLVSVEVLLLSALLLYKLSFSTKLIATWCIAVAMGFGMIILYNFEWYLKLIALFSSILFPTCAIAILIVRNVKIVESETSQVSTFKLLKLSFYNSMIALILCLIGGLVIASLLSSTSYLQEIILFRGIKFALVLPMMLTFVIALIKYFGNQNERIWNLVIGIFKQSLTIWQVILFAVIAGVMFVYIARTGHETFVQPLEIEILVRDFLERVLLARPRIKEFMIGYPSIFLMTYCAFYRRKILLFIATISTTIGLTCTINTFAHLRTPLYMSISRTLIGYVLGIFISSVLMLILNGLKKVKNHNIISDVSKS